MAIIETREALPHELPIAATVPARGMRDNPAHVVFFGADEEVLRKKLEKFYSINLLSMAHLPWAATRAGKLVAPCGTARPGECQLALSQKRAAHA